MQENKQSVILNNEFWSNINIISKEIYTHLKGKKDDFHHGIY